MKDEQQQQKKIYNNLHNFDEKFPSHGRVIKISILNSFNNLDWVFYAQFIAA